MDTLGVSTREELTINEGLAQWIFLSKFRILEGFCAIIVPGNLPVMRRGHFGKYNPKADRTKMTYEQKELEDKIVLLELLPEFALGHGYFAQDELTKGLREMTETKKIPIWLSFATTVLLDIHHVFRSKVDYGFHSLQETGTLVKGAINRYLEFSKDIPHPVTYKKSNDVALQKYVEGMYTSWMMFSAIISAILWLIQSRYRKSYPQRLYIYYQRRNLRYAWTTCTRRRREVLSSEATANSLRHLSF